MIHDVFIRRYPQRLVYEGDAPLFARFFMQAGHLIFVDLTPALSLNESFFENVHNATARELGTGALFAGNSYTKICAQFLTQEPDPFRDGAGDLFAKTRLTLIELLFREAEKRCEPPVGLEPLSGLLSRWRRPAESSAVRTPARDAYDAAVDELNSRFRQAGIPLHYHNGMIQFAHDELSAERIAEPCWALLRDARWANVDLELKEAFDRADTGKADAAFHAAKALESTIKVVCDQKGWTTGREKGAASYIDRLASQGNGRFLERWEADMLKAFFTHVRNPHGHGAGSQPPEH